MSTIGLCIESISITNFQSHAETRLALAGEGCLTVIVGPTDSGKTSIVRALKWVMYNQPAGTGFTRAGTARSRVSVELASGARVTRLRSASRNEYRLSLSRDSHGHEEQVFEGFGASVPAEVQQTLGVYPVPVGDLVLLANLAEQLDGPFLGRGVPSTLRAKALGRLAGSEVLDLASNRLGVDIHRGFRERERLERELGLVESDISRHSWVIPVADKVRSAEELVSGISEKVEVIERCRALSDELAGLPEPSAATGRIAAIRSVLSRAHIADKQLSDRVERLRRVTYLSHGKDLAVQGVDSAALTLRRLEQAMDDVQETYTSLAAELEYCPTCGQRLPEGGAGSGSSAH